MKKVIFSAFVSVLMVCAGCGKQNRSDRDTRRDQIRANAESKRREFAPVTGDYRGYVEQKSGLRQDVTLHLEVKDLPESEEGEVDPVLVPKLAGYLRFNFGESEESFIGFAVAEAEFDGQTRRLYLNVLNDEYKDIVLDMTLAGTSLTGQWTAEAISTDGTVILEKGADGASLTGLDHQIGGEYNGLAMLRPTGMFQEAEIIIKATPRPSKGVSIMASVKLYRGSRSDNEFLYFDYPNCDFNPISGKVVMKRDDSEVSFSGTFLNGALNGEWSSRSLGYHGKFEVAKDFDRSSLSTDLKPMPSVSGVYEGSLTNLTSRTSLPEKIQVGLATSEDRVNSPYGLQITGGMRLYLGSGSEYSELSFGDIEFNHYTGSFYAKTVGNYKFKITGKLSDGRLDATLHHESLGKIAVIEVIKK